MTSYLTAEELDALQSSDLPRNTPYIIQGVTQTIFSIARHYGGATVYGKSYVYIPPSDELIRADVMKWVGKRRKPAKPAKTHTQKELL